jgi:hypothetical protein
VSKLYLKEKPEAQRTDVERYLADATMLGLNRDQLARLRHAYMLQEKGTKRDRRRATEIGAEVKRELLAQLNESVDLEKKRGGKVIQPKSGPVRMSHRDGLQLLWDSGALSRRQLLAGMAVRELAELCTDGLRSQLEDRVGGGGSGSNDGLIVHLLLSAKNTLFLSYIEAAVQSKSRNGRELTMLRLVAGEGRTISSVSRAGADRALNTAALKVALTAAADILKLA